MPGFHPQDGEILASVPFRQSILPSCAQLPNEQELLESSSLLKVFPHLKNQSRALEITANEYVYYLSVTYAFESTGYELIQILQGHAPSEEMQLALLDQRADEENHKLSYGEVIAGLGKCGDLALPVLPEIKQSFVSSYSLGEMLVKGFIILESLAYGMFVARLRYFPSGPTRALDLRVLREETQHQNSGLIFLTHEMAEGRITIENIENIVHEETRKLALGCPPSSYCKDKLVRCGLPGFQVRASARRICFLLNQLKQDGRHAAK